MTTQRPTTQFSRFMRYFFFVSHSLVWFCSDVLSNLTIKYFSHCTRNTRACTNDDGQRIVKMANCSSWGIKIRMYRWKQTFENVPWHCSINVYFLFVCLNARVRKGARMCIKFKAIHVGQNCQVRMRRSRFETKFETVHTLFSNRRFIAQKKRDRKKMQKKRKERIFGDLTIKQLCHWLFICGFLQCIRFYKSSLENYVEIRNNNIYLWFNGA